jgi:transcription termination/antitermination protein NusG
MNGSSQVPRSDFLGIGDIALLDQQLWYAIRTRSRHEKMVSEQLLNQGIENFLPLVKRVHNWSDRRKIVKLPLFSGYVFVRVAFSSRDRIRIRQTHGVAGFVGSGLPIPDAQIHDIKTLLANQIPLKDHPFLRIGQRVRIRGGALDGIEGILAAQNGDRSFVVSLEPIQRSLSIRIDGYTVEPA